MKTSMKKFVVWTIIIAAAAGATIGISLTLRRLFPGSMRIQGAVIRKDDDTRKERPIPDAVVTVSDGKTTATTESDARGYFRLTFPKRIWQGQTLQLSFEHPDFQPLEMKLQTGLRRTTKELYVAAMVPVPEKAAATSADHRASVVSNLRVRYTTNSQEQMNIGSAVKTFQVINKGNVPCGNTSPCSPDEVWKAATGSVSLDAGLGNEFANVRASCIAGPCPFTRVDFSGFMHGGRNITVAALNWSDTATFLVEAEVFHTSISSNVRQSYPVVFGRTLTFTLPPTNEGASLEAEIDGDPMVFPLGPNLYLSWANCTGRTGQEAEKTTVYRCELKSGYRF
jgi:hypothetical protein